MKYLDVVNDYANYFYDAIVEINRVDRLTNPYNFKFKLYTIKELIVIMKNDPIFDHLIIEENNQKFVDIFESHDPYITLRNIRKKFNPYFTCELNNVCIFYYELDQKLKQRMQSEYRNFILERLLIIAAFLLLIAFCRNQL